VRRYVCIISFTKRTKREALPNHTEQKDLRAGRLGRLGARIDEHGLVKRVDDGVPPRKEAQQSNATRRMQPPRPGYRSVPPYVFQCVLTTIGFPKRSESAPR
jgi:hypothetical protein